MTLKLRVATIEDASALTDIYLSAFSNDALSFLVFPRGPKTTEFWYSSIISEISDPNSHFLCVIDTSLPNSPPIAYGKWNSPSTPLPDPSDLPVWPANQKIGDHFFRSLMQNHIDIMGERKHWYLEILATKQEYQGKGAGSMILKWGLQKADEDGVESFLEASPAGLPIYERYGWKERGRLVIDLEGKVEQQSEFVEVFMVRDARKPVGT